MNKFFYYKNVVTGNYLGISDSIGYYESDTPSLLKESLNFQTDNFIHNWLMNAGFSVLDYKEFYIELT